MVLYVSLLLLLLLLLLLSIIGKLIPVLTCAGLLSLARHGTFLEDLDQGRWASRMGGGQALLEVEGMWTRLAYQVPSLP